MTISFGCDHAGFRYKAMLLAHLRAAGHEIIDHGCHSEEPVDFPNVARAVCAAILDGKAARGIMLCGSGVGAAIACNKVKGIRAFCCHDIYSASQSVEHDDVQVACFGADVLGAAALRKLADEYLRAAFSGGEEFIRRIALLDEMDKQ